MDLERNQFWFPGLHEDLQLWGSDRDLRGTYSHEGRLPGSLGRGEEEDRGVY